jgi:hypothetical protein
MKMKEIFFRSQFPLILIVFSFILTSLISCKKEAERFEPELFDSEITKYQWEIVSILTEDTVRNFSKDVIFREYSYVLWFQNDSVFQLNFSVNSGIGYYELFPENKIAVKSYSNQTKAFMSKFDWLLMSEFNKMTSYDVIDKTLIFRGPDSEVELQITERSIKYPN